MSIETKGEEMRFYRRRVLLLAYACSPYRGSEAGVGWHRVVEISKYFDTWVICKKQKYENDIKRYFAENGEISNLKFCFVPRTRFEKLLKLIPGLFYVAYNIWHRRAYRVAVELENKLHFDLVHQVTMCGFREPGYLWKLGIPFIWGPVGGTQNYPWRFLAIAGIDGAIREGMRNIFNLFQLRFNSRVKKSAKRSAVFLAANSTGLHDFERIHKVKPILELDVGASIMASETSRKDPHRGPLRILWSGNFDHHKALHLLIRALGKLPDSVKYELKILGSGPLKKRWRRMAKREGIEVHCTWAGWLPYDEAMAQYDWADIFVFTSLRDTCGTVVVEALSRGVPIICIDHQGVGDVVTEKCGIKIPATKPDDVIVRFRDAIVNLAENSVRLGELSNYAIERAREFSWLRKGEKMAKIYDETTKITNHTKPTGVYEDMCGLF